MDVVGSAELGKELGRIAERGDASPELVISPGKNRGDATGCVVVARIAHIGRGRNDGRVALCRNAGDALPPRRLDQQPLLHPRHTARAEDQDRATRLQMSAHADEGLTGAQDPVLGIEVYRDDQVGAEEPLGLAPRDNLYVRAVPAQRRGMGDEIECPDRMRRGDDHRPGGGNVLDPPGRDRRAPFHRQKRIEQRRTRSVAKGHQHPAAFAQRKERLPGRHAAQAIDRTQKHQQRLQAKIGPCGNAQTRAQQRFHRIGNGSGHVSITPVATDHEQVRLPAQAVQSVTWTGLRPERRARRTWEEQNDKPRRTGH